MPYLPQPAPEMRQERLEIPPQSKHAHMARKTPPPGKSEGPKSASVAAEATSSAAALSPDVPSAKADARGFDQVEALPTFRESHGLLSPAHQRFCQEYLADFNGPRAYLAVYKEATYETARSESSRLLADARIQREVQCLMDERAKVTGITAQRILLEMFQLAMADPRELVEVRIGCCRHCWGLYYQHQYTEAELERAEHEHIQAEAKRRKAEREDFEPKPFHAKGGGGLERNPQPNPECPECGGDGQERSVLKDTRNLSPGAARLFGGVKIDKQGKAMVLVRDQVQALMKVGEHLGLWNDKLPGPQDIDPLRALLEEIRGQSGTAAALPIVHDDPERRPRADIEDVTQRQPLQPKPVLGRWKPKT